MEKQPSDATTSALATGDTSNSQRASVPEPQPSQSVNRPEAKQQNVVLTSITTTLVTIIVLLGCLSWYLKNHSGLTAEEKKEYQRSLGNSKAGEIMDLIRKEEAEEENRKKAATTPTQGTSH